MSKRRNPKKEKAERNRAYARKFRKAPTGRFHRRRDPWDSAGQNAAETNEADNEGAQG